MEVVLIKAFLLLFIITVIWDFSGVIYDLSKFVYKTLNPNKPYMGQSLPKIISCSYCIKFHTTWIYLILINDMNIIYGFAIASVFTFIGLLLVKLLKKLENRINKL